MTNLPPSIDAALDAAVEAYRKKLSLEAHGALLMHSGHMATAAQSDAITRARVACDMARDSYVCAVLREALK